MKKYWFPWTPCRYKAQTMHLTPEQDGIYRRLIDHYMETKKPLPDNDIALSRIAGAPVDKYGDDLLVVKAFFKKDKAGNLRNLRCDQNLKEEKQLSNKRKESGSLGGKSRAQKANKKQELPNNPQASANQVLNQNQAQNRTEPNITELSINKDSKTPINIKKNKNKKADLPNYNLELLLDGVDIENVKKRFPNTDIYHFIAEFNCEVNAGKVIRPTKSPCGSFIEWCQRVQSL